MNGRKFVPVLIGTASPIMVKLQATQIIRLIQKGQVSKFLNLNNGTLFQN